MSRAPARAVAAGQVAVTALSDPAAEAAIHGACRALGLSTVRTETARIAEAAARERLSHKAFLAEVLLAECDVRDSRRRVRRVNEAKFPRTKRGSPAITVVRERCAIARRGAGGVGVVARMARRVGAPTATNPGATRACYDLTEPCP